LPLGVLLTAAASICLYNHIELSKKWVRISAGNSAGGPSSSSPTIKPRCYGRGEWSFML
jgi:hypothetical protein